MKGKIIATGKIPGLGGKSMAVASAGSVSGKAIPGGSGKSMVRDLPAVSGKATGRS